MEIFYIIAALVLLIGVFVGFKMFDLNLSLLVATAAVALLVPLPVYAIATTVAKNDSQTFHEYWNGFEESATTKVVTCTRDGSCVNDYSCDPYTVVETYTDSEGKLKTRIVTKYHQCPYSTEETTYLVGTTLGVYTIAENVMTGPAYDVFRGIPGGQVTSPPTLWTEAKTRIDSNLPGPVTKVNDYKNYILASERTLFKSYSDKIDSYLTSGLLPKPASGVANFYFAQKSYFPNNPLPTELQQTLTSDASYLNAAVGQELQGDLHIVFVGANEAGDPTDYSNSLVAYWKSKELGRDAIAKNSIILVVGVGEYKAPPAVLSPLPEGSNISVEDEIVEPSEVDSIKDGTPVAEWVRAFTGMPLGNEALLIQLQSSLQGVAIDDQFIGHPNYDIASEKVVHTSGAVENILYGSNKFNRVSMDALDSDDNGSGFGYLAEEWVPDAGLMALIYGISSILLLGVAAAGVVFAFKVGYDMNDPVRTLVTPNKRKA